MAPCVQRNACSKRLNLEVWQPHMRGTGRYPCRALICGSMSLPGGAYSASATTVTDFGGSCHTNASPLREPLKLFGCTAFGLSNVLRESISGAVSTRPDTSLAFAPVSVAVTVAGLFGSRFASAT